MAWEDKTYIGRQEGLSKDDREGRRHPCYLQSSVRCRLGLSTIRAHPDDGHESGLHGRNDLINRRSAVDQCHAG